MANTPKEPSPVRRYSMLPTPLMKAAEGVTRHIFRQHGIAESRIITEWPLIAGPVLAQKSLPIKLSFPQGQKANGTLHLRVASGWALEVQHLEPIILDKIATYFGYRAVSKLFLQQGPLPERPKKAEVKPEPELTADEVRVLASITSKVEDPELKEALNRLGAALIAGSSQKERP